MIFLNLHDATLNANAALSWSNATAIVSGLGGATGVAIVEVFAQ